jgi:hypothetical protein
MMAERALTRIGNLDRLFPLKSERIKKNIIMRKVSKILSCMVPQKQKNET